MERRNVFPSRRQGRLPRGMVCGLLPLPNGCSIAYLNISLIDFTFRRMSKHWS